MAEPLNQTQPQTKGKERVFSFKYVFEVEIKEVFDEVSRQYYTIDKVRINGKEFSVYKWETFEDILKGMRKKIAVLQHVSSNDAYDAISQDILLDIAKILYRIHYKLDY